MQTVICSHGFGVKADGRGMFPALAAVLSDCKFVMFDYNTIHENGDILLTSLDEQVAKLQNEINNNPDESILLCHSQGCVVAGLVDLSKVSKVILLAPPTKTSIQQFMSSMMGRPGSDIRMDGISKLPRSDGTMTLVPPMYAQKLMGIDPFSLYEHVAKTKPTLIVRATEDEVVGLTNVNEVRSATHKDIACGHNFSGDARTQLGSILKEYIT